MKAISPESVMDRVAHHLERKCESTLPQSPFLQGRGIPDQLNWRTRIAMTKRLPEGSEMRGKFKGCYLRKVALSPTDARSVAVCADVPESGLRWDRAGIS